ncbi:unnamed protein product [Closterium sp. Naga37s-1]|nr:unnamed protein product [Closterium sp. Naga37s-1]
MGAEPDLSQVAQVSLLYGWMKDPKTTCDDLARLVDDDVSDAVPPAGNVLVERGQQLLKEFPTTLGEDLQLWRQLHVCKARVLFGAVEGGEGGDGGGGDGVDAGQCGADYVRELGEWEVILRAVEKEAGSQGQGQCRAWQWLTGVHNSSSCG